MSRRRPWEIPVEYIEDRFSDQPSRHLDDQVGGSIKPDPDLIVSRIQEAQSGRTTKPARPQKPAPNKSIDSGQRSAGNPRPSWRDGIANRSNDESPINYGRGPHEGELDVDDRDELD